MLLPWYSQDEITIIDSGNARTVFHSSRYRCIFVLACVRSDRVLSSTVGLQTLYEHDMFRY